MYFKLGKIINDNSKWGDKFIETLEIELKLSFPNIKGFSSRNLRRMKKFYIEYKDEEILPLAVAKLPWTHNIMLIEKIKDRSLSTEEQKDVLGLIGELSDIEKRNLINEVLNAVNYNFIVTPKEVDFQIDKLADLLSSGINKCLHREEKSVK